MALYYGRSHITYDVSSVAYRWVVHRHMTLLMTMLLAMTLTMVMLVVARVAVVVVVVVYMGVVTAVITVTDTVTVTVTAMVTAMMIDVGAGLVVDVLLPASTLGMVIVVDSRTLWPCTMGDHISHMTCRQRRTGG